MPEFDWRSPDSFKSLENAEITEIAWVGLRMNVDYQRDYDAIIANNSDGAVTEEVVSAVEGQMSRVPVDGAVDLPWFRADRFEYPTHAVPSCSR